MKTEMGEFSIAGTSGKVLKESHYETGGQSIVAAT
jgi:hypothetical protein